MSRLKTVLLKTVTATTEVAHAAVLTWLLFMAVQALALHFIAEGF